MKKDVGVKNKKLQRGQLLQTEVGVDKGIGRKKIHSNYTSGRQGVGLWAIKAAARNKTRGSVGRNRGSGRPNAAGNRKDAAEVKAPPESECGKEKSLNAPPAAFEPRETTCQGIVTKLPAQKP